MRRLGWINLALSLALLSAWALLGWLRVDPESRNPYWLQGMAESPAFQAQSPNPWFANGQTAQEPPAGTVVRHLPPLHLRPGHEGQEEAGRNLRNPYASTDAEALARGKEVWAHTCMACHGPQGQGDGPVPAHGFPQPPSLVASHARGMKDGAIFHLVSLGDGLMPSYAVQLPREDRWKAVLYLRQLQKEAGSR